MSNVQMFSAGSVLSSVCEQIKEGNSGNCGLDLYEESVMLVKYSNCFFIVYRTLINKYEMYLTGAVKEC